MENVSYRLVSGNNTIYRIVKKSKIIPLEDPINHSCISFH